MTDIQATFRSKGDRVYDAFNYLQDNYKNLTNYETYGKNNVLNMAVILAAKKLKEEKEQKTESEKEIMDGLEFDGEFENEK